MSDSFLSFPWERGEKPFFENEKYKWYVDKDTMKYIRKKELKNVFCFFVKKNDSIERVLIDHEQNVLFSSKSWESILMRIDIIYLANIK